MKGTTVYSSRSGLEVRAVATRKEKGGYSLEIGRVKLRAFPLEKGSGSIRMILNTVECYRLSRALKVVLREKKKNTTVIIHTTNNGNGKETTARVILDYFTVKGKEGIGVILTRDGDKVNVPMDVDTALYLSDLLLHLAMEQSWETNRKVEKINEEEGEELELESF